jgi:flagellar hook assembly protein FlgD
VTVVDLLGRVIATLVDGEEGPGVHTVTWQPSDRSGRDLPPGVYLYRMQAVSESTHDYHTIKKMLFVR